MEQVITGSRFHLEDAMVYLLESQMVSTRGKGWCYVENNCINHFLGDMDRRKFAGLLKEKARCFGLWKRDNLLASLQASTTNDFTGSLYIIVNS